MQKFKNKRCVIYARYSCHNQTEQSIEGQMHDCERYAAEHGLFIVDTYIDRALTATSDRRPAFQEMIKDSGKKLFDAILVWKLDRFARNRYDSAVYKRVLRSNGVTVISVMENISDSPEGVLMESVLEGFAEYFSKDLSQKVQRGMRETAAKHRIVGRIPFGYRKSSEGTYEPDEITAPAVQMIFRMYVNGERKADIAEYLNNHGYKTSCGNKFTKECISPIVQNARYTGNYKYDNMEIHDENQRIVSDELFEKASSMAKVLHNKGAMHRASKRYILTGKLYCGECHRKMHGETGRSGNGNKHYYYLCTGRKKLKDCNALNVQKDYIEDCVLSSINELLSNPKIIERIADTILQRQKAENCNADIIAALNSQLAAVKRKINNVLNAIESGIVTPTTKERLQELETTKNELEYEIDIQKAQSCRFTKAQLINFFTSMNLNDDATVQEKQQLVQQLINRIYVWKDKILIIYNFTGNNGTDPDAEFEKDIEKLIKKTVTENCSVTEVFGSSSPARTDDPAVNSRMLCQLSYRGILK